MWRRRLPTVLAVVLLLALVGWMGLQMHMALPAHEQHRAPHGHDNADDALPAHLHASEAAAASPSPPIPPTAASQQDASAPSPPAHTTAAPAPPNLSLIPRNILQTWKRQELPSQAQSVVAEWRRLNPHHTWRLFTDPDIDAMVSEHFPSLLPAYAKMRPIQKADLLRYMALYLYGGVYADMDVQPLQPVDNWLAVTGDLFSVDLIVGFEALATPGQIERHEFAREFQFVQWCMAAAPRHPVVADVLERIREYFAARSAEEIATGSVIRSTGPGIWSDAVNAYLQRRHNVTLGQPPFLRPRLADSFTHIGSVLLGPLRSFGGSPSASGDDVFIQHNFWGSWKSGANRRFVDSHPDSVSPDHAGLNAHINNNNNKDRHDQSILRPAPTRIRTQCVPPPPAFPSIANVVASLSPNTPTPSLLEVCVTAATALPNSAPLADAQEGPAMAVDGVPHTKLLLRNNFTFAPAALELRFAAPAALDLRAYTLLSANDVPHRDPAAVRLLGSRSLSPQDTPEWQLLDEQPRLLFSSRFQRKTFVLDPPAGNISALRLEILSVAGPASHSVQLADLGLEWAPIGVSPKTTSRRRADKEPNPETTATAPLTSSSPAPMCAATPDGAVSVCSNASLPSPLFDGRPQTVWVGSHPYPCLTLQPSAGRRLPRIAAYWLAMADNNAPVNWTLTGRSSPRSPRWLPLDRQRNVDLRDRFAGAEFALSAKARRTLARLRKAPAPQLALCFDQPRVELSELGLLNTSRWFFNTHSWLTKVPDHAQALRELLPLPAPAAYARSRLARAAPPIADCRVPPLIHFTWRSNRLPQAFDRLLGSWRRLHPDWRLRVWTDRDNRQLVQSHFPDFLPVYDAYPKNIQRADAIRYLILYVHGGLYVDLDFEALRPMGRLFGARACMLGQEPHLQTHVLYKNLTRMVSNAFMASCPGHPFWLKVLHELKLRQHIKTVRATGPKMLTRAWETYFASDMGLEFPVTLLKPELVIPQFDASNDALRKRCMDLEGAAPLRIQACETLNAQGFMNKPIPKKAFSTHHWFHSWLEYGGQFGMLDPWMGTVDARKIEQ